MSDHESHKLEGEEIALHNRKIASGNFDTPTTDEIYAKARELVHEAAKLIVQGMINHDSSAADYLDVEQMAHWLEDGSLGALDEYIDAALAEREEI
jgi:thiamine pyrophosphate-dependent acetolactate synthase large subunit-like protein